MNQLERRVLEIIGENPDSPDVFTASNIAPIRDALNDAIQEIAMITGSRVTTYYLPLRQEQAFYRFALNDGYLGWVTDAWSINQDRRLERTDLVRLAAHDPRWMVSSAEPRSYFQVGHDVIGFYPKPSSDSNTMRLNIVEIPKAYTDDADRINLRDDFEYAAVNYAVSEYWASRGDARSAEAFYGYYADTLGLKDAHIESRDWVPSFETRKDPYPKDTA